MCVCSGCALQQPLFFQLHKASLEVTKTREDMKSLQVDLTNAEKEITVRKILENIVSFPAPENVWFTLLNLCPQSLKEKLEDLQKTFGTPTRRNEALSRLLFERCEAVPSQISVCVGKL